MARNMHSSEIVVVYAREKLKAYKSLDVCGHNQDTMFYDYNI